MDLALSYGYYDSKIMAVTKEPVPSSEFLKGLEFHAAGSIEQWQDIARYGRMMRYDEYKCLEHISALTKCNASTDSLRICIGLCSLYAYT
jgi:hypothetical protein